MQVIGAGYGRTGTTSLKLALEHLGYPCYHMEEVMKNYRRGHIKQWTEVLNDTAVPDWAELFQGYEATVDFPACVFYRELMDAFPDAVVVLSVRDSEGWWNSFSQLARLALNTRFLSFLPIFRSFSKLSRSLFESVFSGSIERERCIECYERHNENVKATVPSERLLVYSVTEGWGPLCDFLNQPVPDIPFPHANAGMGEVRQKMRAVLFDQLSFGRLRRRRQAKKG